MTDIDIDYDEHYMNRTIASAAKEVLGWMDHITECAPSIVFDIGANVGVYTLLFAKLLPSSRIYAFEPVAENYMTLVRNIIKNRVTNVIPMPIGLWSHCCTMALGIPIERDRMNTGLYSALIGNDGHDVRQGSFQSFSWATEFAGGVPGFMKLDAGGAETVILGTADKLLAQVDVVAVEFNHDLRFANAPKIIGDALTAAGMNKVWQGHDLDMRAYDTLWTRDTKGAHVR